MKNTVGCSNLVRRRAKLFRKSREGRRQGGNKDVKSGSYVCTNARASFAFGSTHKMKRLKEDQRCVVQQMRARAPAGSGAIFAEASIIGEVPLQF